MHGALSAATPQVLVIAYISQELTKKHTCYNGEEVGWQGLYFIHDDLIN
jgi:hypothetical protein